MSILDRHQLRCELDLNGWNLRIWAVAASGFLTDSYNLFSTNVILASISFVYFPDDKWPGLLINVFTLLGSVVGQLLFGYLADRYGRTRLYGVELVLVIVSTIGVATSSFGFENNMSFLGTFIWWRFVMGVGIGAEYPLSAVITSEWSSTQSRATMLSSVFLMQPVGQALAQLVGLWVLLGREGRFQLAELQCGLNDLHEAQCRRAVDGIWRIVIGSGAVPALLAIVFRFFLYDCGLYSLEVKNKPGIALRDTQRVYGATPAPAPVAAAIDINLGSSSSPGPGNGTIPMTSMQQQISPQPMPVQFSRDDLYNYFIRDQNWLYLLGTSMTWFILDVGFYGVSLDNRGTLADIWAKRPAVALDASLPCWNSTLPDGGGTSAVPQWQARGGALPAWATDATKPCQTISEVLVEQAQQYLVTVSASSIAGSAAFIWFVSESGRHPTWPRRQWLTASFVALAALFIAAGAVYYGGAHTRAAPATVALVAVCHFAFNFGANTLTFLLPAEIFPTCYRATCHGVSAAAGKVGSLIAVLAVYGINNARYRDDGASSESPSPETRRGRQGLVFVTFGCVLLLGAVCSWAYLPDPQRFRPRPDGDGGGRSGGRWESKTLEELGGGRERARLVEGEILTVREKVREVRRRRRERRRAGGALAAAAAPTPTLRAGISGMDIPSRVAAAGGRHQPNVDVEALQHQGVGVYEGAAQHQQHDSRWPSGSGSSGQRRMD
ncbi:hypothetical protein SLS62_000205 [Diatrype stigma]|uniref:Major facilitator superfamily (MFS) profile domain-containing protein n=1 Tax=Diatrype stigma TaxID=117547 RepID=A0AAN9V2F0_9PEZI